MDRPQGEGWWLAADGRWYPPEASAAAASPDLPSQPIATAAQVVFYVVTGLTLGAALAQFNEIVRFGAFMGDDGDARALSDLADAEEVTGIFVLLAGLAMIGLFMLTLVWMHQAYRATDRYPAHGRTWGAGWAVGGWFIPIANYVIPKLVVNEIDRVSDPANTALLADGRWRAGEVMGISNAWWALFVVGSVLFWVGSGIAGTEVDQGSILDFDAGRYRTGLWLIALGLMVWAGAAVAGSAVVRRLTERLHAG